MTANSILGILTPYQNKVTKLVNDQSTGDIISAITTAHEQYKPEYKKISYLFKGGNSKQTGKKIFDFLKRNVKYKIESGEAQTVKSPSAILAQGHGDCKHYSLFAGGVLGSLGVPFAYRFASYKTFSREPGHVFTVINPGTDNEIWVDPVLPEFNYHKPYTYAKDKKMAVYSIAGIGATKAQKTAIKAAKAAKKAAPKGVAKKQAKAAVKAAKKAAGTTLGQKLKKGAKVILKVAASPARNAFLLLVKVNFANLAVKLSKAWDKEPSKITEFWNGIGGQINNLKKQWEKGRTKKRILGCTECQAEIGFAPAAAAAAAAPILAKVAQVLKNIGIDPEELVQIGKEAINEKAQQLVKEALVPTAQDQAETIAVAQMATGEELGPVPTQSQAVISPTTATSLQETTTTTTTGNNINKILPWVAAGAVIYFIAKK